MAEWLAQGLHGLQQQHQEHPQAALVVSALLVFPLLVLLVRRLTTPAEARAREQLLSKLPSPPSLPVIGHLHLVGTLPHISVAELAAKHGRDGLLLLRLGAFPTLVVSSAAAAETVLRTQDLVFASRASSTVTDILFYGSSDPAFAPHGEHWRQAKKISITHLLSNKKVRSYRRAREQEVRLVVAQIRKAALAGTTFDMSTMFASYLNNITCHAVFGRFFKEGGRINRIFQELTDENAALLGGFNLETLFPSLARLSIVKKLVCTKVQKVHKVWDDLLNKLIEEHESNPVSDVDSEESDFIDVLLSIQHEYQLTRDHIKAQLVVTFQGGIDTGSAALDYAMVKLMQNPHMMAKLQNEVRKVVPQGSEMVSEDDLDGMVYLKAVVKETLRLHGPAPFLLPHFSMAECVVEGHTIPSGIRTFVNARAISRDPNYWESPEEFMPERFMEGGSAAALDFRGNDYVYLPFGSGRRKCPGINLAILTIEHMLANLMYHFNWELTPETAEKGIDMTESFGSTVHRINSLFLAPVLPKN